MIEVINYHNEEYEKPLESDIERYYDEVRNLLPELPSSVKVYFGDYGLVPELGVGGFAYTKDIMSLSLDSNFSSREDLGNNLRSTVFHESFHQYQGFTGDGPPRSGIENAIYEGMATVFENTFTNSIQPYGDYSGCDEDSLSRWKNELDKLSPEDFQNENIYRKWKFYHNDYGERWIAYKTGVWIVDNVMSKYDLKILDLRDKTAAEVLELFNAKY